MKFSVKKNRYFREIIFATGNHLDALAQARRSRHESLRRSEASLCIALGTIARAQIASLRAPPRLLASVRPSRT
jgi:hypothetical protein